jgi:hypothetical protein
MRHSGRNGRRLAFVGMQPSSSDDRRIGPKESAAGLALSMGLRAASAEGRVKRRLGEACSAVRPLASAVEEDQLLKQSVLARCLRKDLA